jgi:hypothetical protein
VIKAFVDKQHQLPPKLADKPKSEKKVEIGAVWTVPDSDDDKDKLQSGRFFLDVSKKRPVAAMTAPGMQ